MMSKSTELDQASKDHILNGPHETMGQYLQRARIDQEITLDAVAEATCIHITTIKALEEDDYDKLPADVFVRGFIKIYANLLHLDAEKALSLYQPVPNPENDNYSSGKGSRQRMLPTETLAEASPFTAGRQLLIFLTLVVLALGTYQIFFSNPQPETSNQETETKKTVISEPAQQEPAAEPAHPNSHPDTAALTLPEPMQAENNSTTLPAATQTTTFATPDLQPPPSPIIDQQETAPPPAETEKVAAVIAPPRAPAERLIIEPQRRKTVRKPQPMAAITEELALDEENNLPTEANKASMPELPAEPVVNESAMVLNTPGAVTNPTTPPPATTTKAAPFAYILKAEFTDLTWLEVIVDDGQLHEYTFRAGEQWEWRAKEEIKLHVGNAGGVNLSLNNKSLPVLGETGTSVRITLPTAPR